jgi:hypothetical protein
MSSSLNDHTTSTELSSLPSSASLNSHSGSGQDEIVLRGKGVLVAALEKVGRHNRYI